MIEFNTYPVFVADQVLTADHLNEIVNYLDEQDRLTRNKLIGIGIVCGLEIKASTEQIVVSKGCGVTSEGYLVVQSEATYTHYRPYDLPEYFSPKHKPVYETWRMHELLNTEDSLEFDDAEFIKNAPVFMSTKVVVLLLEMKEIPLENCIDVDCDDKGDEIKFDVKPLLVEREDLDIFMGGSGERPLNGVSQPIAPSNLPAIALKRFNVPVADLKNTNDVLNAFLELVDENTLKQVAEALNFCYLYYHPLLGEASNPFGNVFNAFKDRLSFIKVANPLFIQYFYDWIDDIIKAYDEFRYKIVDVRAVCCPDEALFPLHLMLGEATKNTAVDAKSKYRHYFIYSPLFNEQQDRLPEIQLLFQRLKTIVNQYNIPNANTFFNAPVRITPSRYYDKPLSDRCIPYYYRPLEAYPVWSWEKTRRGESKNNLSYNAAQYSTTDAVVSPLKYDIEAYNFFRIEGHIGKPFTRALTTVVNQRDQFNLPFDVVALSTATVSAFLDAKEHDCQFNDLESIYQVLLAELRCKLGDFECRAGKMPYQITFDRVVGDISGDVSPDNPNQPFTTFRVGQFSAIRNIANLRTAEYVRGDFMRTQCTIDKGSVGEAYLNAVKNGVFFTKPSLGNRTSRVTLSSAAVNPLFLIYAYVFYFIDTVENTFAVSLNQPLDDFDTAVFSARYRAFTEIVKELADIGEELERIDRQSDNENSLIKQLKAIGFYDFALSIRDLRHLCLHERLEALREEYERRKRELQLLTNFLNYFKKRPGMEHKAGVPRGGTFILVYHETPPRRLVADLSSIDRLVADLPGSVSAFKVGNREITNLNELIKTSYVQDPQLLKKFESALGKFVNTCQDLDEETKNNIKNILVAVPPEPEPPRFRIPEQAVIADFYLPYICCSDCPPIAYVVPKTPEDVLSINLQPTEICNNDEKVYPVNVSPQGGTLKASQGGVTEGQFEFSPKGISPGINTLTYTLPDGRSTSTDVKIVGGFEVKFKFQVLEDGLTVLFSPVPPQEDREVLWDFGDGNTSNEQFPKHTYQLDDEEQSFTVVLTVDDPPCTAVMEEKITLKKPREEAFDLLPKIFCVNDAKEYDFTIHPFPDKVESITNEDRLILNLDEDNNRLFFKPNRHRIGSSKDFRLEYQGISLDVRVVVPDASFVMNIKQAENDFLLTLRAKQEDATQYEWKVVQEELSYSFERREVTLSLQELKIIPGQTILITLTVNHQLPSGNCRDAKELKLTEAIFFKHVNQGEFDNETEE
jgi:PKD repeat protein